MLIPQQAPKDAWILQWNPAQQLSIVLNSIGAELTAAMSRTTTDSLKTTKPAFIAFLNSASSHSLSPTFSCTAYPEYALPAGMFVVSVASNAEG